MYELINALLDNSSFKSNVKYAMKEFKANEKILEQGKEHPNLFLIQKGVVKVIIHADIKESSTIQPGIANLEKNDIFGEFALFDDLPASADVVAVIDSELIEIDIQSFKVFLAENPKIGYQVFQEMLQRLVKRLRHADKAIYNLYVWGIKAHRLDQCM